MDPVPVLALIGLLFVKEAGVPVPVPGDLIVLGAGVAASGTVGAGPIELVAILLAGYAGGSVQFVVVRGALRDRLLHLLARLQRDTLLPESDGLTAARLTETITALTALESTR